MRKNTENVFNAWTKRIRYGKTGDAIWTDGVNIISYYTDILVDRNQGVYILNMAKYSQTTTIHQRGIKTLLENNRIIFDEVVCADALNKHSTSGTR